MNLESKNNYTFNKAMMRKSTKRNCTKRRWGSGSHLQGIFGSASLSWLEETIEYSNPPWLR